MSSERQVRRKLKQIVFKNINSVYNVSKGLCDDFNKEIIPLKTLKVLLENSKLKFEKGSEFEDFSIKYNLVMDSIFEDLKAQSESMNTDSIPLVRLKHAIDLVKSSFEQGMK